MRLRTFGREDGRLAVDGYVGHELGLGTSAVRSTGVSKELFHLCLVVVSTHFNVHRLTLPGDCLHILDVIRIGVIDDRSPCERLKISKLQDGKAHPGEYTLRTNRAFS